MILNPNVIKTLKEAGKLIVKVGPIVIDTATALTRKIRDGRKDLDGAKVEDVDKAPDELQEQGQKVDVCLRDLASHRKAIVRNSKVLTEHVELIQELAEQGQQLARFTDAVARWVKVCLCICAISLAATVVAILVVAFN